MFFFRYSEWIFVENERFTLALVFFFFALFVSFTLLWLVRRNLLKVFLTEIASLYTVFLYITVLKYFE